MMQHTNCPAPQSVIVKNVDEEPEHDVRAGVGQQLNELGSTTSPAMLTPTTLQKILAQIYAKNMYRHQSVPFLFQHRHHIRCQGKAAGHPITNRQILETLKGQPPSDCNTDAEPNQIA
ncbi:hypothetical protein [Sphingobium sp. TB-6]|uniref:hypothetical protein n=1 Tax=Sphingobium sp. TB-6 TaxID=2728850 RepID=UPI001F110C79|nr:hypothetical protein [Sphingobium sp. TB-6]